MAKQSNKKKSTKLTAKGFPGSDKILKDFKKTGPNTAKVKSPVVDKRFTTLTEKKSSRAINNYTDMNKSKFDQLFESVVQDEDLGGLDGLDELEGKLDTDASDLGADLDGVADDGLDAEATDRDLSTLLGDLDALVAEIRAKVEAIDGGGSEVSDEFDDGDEFDGGDVDTDFDDEVVKEEEVDAENLGTPLVNQKKNPLHDPRGSNKVDAPGNKPTGGKATSGKIPNVQANPEELSDKGGQSLQDKKKNKVDSNIKGGGQSLFHV